MRLKPSQEFKYGEKKAIARGQEKMREFKIQKCRVRKAILRIRIDFKLPIIEEVIGIIKDTNNKMLKLTKLLKNFKILNKILNVMKKKGATIKNLKQMKITNFRINRMIIFRRIKVIIGLIRVFKTSIVILINGKVKIMEESQIIEVSTIIILKEKIKVKEEEAEDEVITKIKIISTKTNLIKGKEKEEVGEEELEEESLITPKIKGAINNQVGVEEAEEEGCRIINNFRKIITISKAEKNKINGLIKITILKNRLIILMKETIEIKIEDIYKIRIDTQVEVKARFIIISKNRTMAQVKFRLIKIILTIKVLIEKNIHKIEVR